MIDYIKREDAIEIIARHDETNGTVKVFSGRLVNGLLSAIPAADVVEVVRCKDCKRRYVGGNGLTHYWVCDFLDAENKDDGYCSYGERADT